MLYTLSTKSKILCLTLGKTCDRQMGITQNLAIKRVKENAFSVITYHLACTVKAPTIDNILRINKKNFNR